jgi:hypothetical protein
MRLRIVALLLMVAGVAASAWLARPRPLAFAANLDAAFAEARAQSRWVVVHVRRADRPLGSQMDRETVADPEFARAARDGVVHAQLDAASEGACVAPPLRPGVALATLVTEADGSVVAELDGFATTAELVAWLARVRAREAALRDPATPAVTRSEMLFELGATEAAEWSLGPLPEDARVLLLRGRIELARGHVDAARRDLEAVVDRYPATPSAPDAARLLESNLVPNVSR